MAEGLLGWGWEMDVFAGVELEIGRGLVVRQGGDVFCAVVDGGQEVVEVGGFGWVEGDADV